MFRLGRRTHVTGDRATERDPASRPVTDAAPGDSDTSEQDAQIEGMEGAAVSVGPHGEITVDSDGPPETREIPPLPDESDQESDSTAAIAVNEEPSS